MIRFEHTEVTNWHVANRGMRNSYESWDAIDSGYVQSDGYTALDNHGTWIYGPNDYALATRLAKAGASHRKFMRQILVSVDIVAGNEWWKEFDTYKVATVANSTSAMHKLGSRLLTMSDFSFDEPFHPDDVRAIDEFNELVKTWWSEGKRVGTPTWRRM